MTESRFSDWCREVPDSITGDPLWKQKAYRFALYASDLVWEDAALFQKDRRAWGISDQVVRSVGSISANIAEGYSRGGGRDRARFYEYALGSARESRDWYYKSRHLLPPEAVEKRLDLMTHLIRLLVTMTRTERSVHLREPEGAYSALGVPDA